MKTDTFLSKRYHFTLGAALGMLLLATSLNAQQKTCCKPLFQKEDLLPGYNASSRIELQNCPDFFTTGSFIYWQPLQENMQLGVVSDNTNALDLINGYELPLGSEFKPGFKIGLGMNFHHDKWLSNIEYTWFYAHERASISLDPSNTAKAFYPAWQIPDFLNPQYSSASESWKLHMNLLDWDLAREYYVGTELCFRTFFGLRDLATFF